MKIEVTKDCIGCGACAAIAPDIFELDMKAMKSTVKKQPVDKDGEELARQAADACPVDAIKLE